MCDRAVAIEITCWSAIVLRRPALREEEEHPTLAHREGDERLEPVGEPLEDTSARVLEAPLGGQAQCLPEVVEPNERKRPVGDAAGDGAGAGALAVDDDRNPSRLVVVGHPGQRSPGARGPVGGPADGTPVDHEDDGRRAHLDERIR